MSTFSGTRHTSGGFLWTVSPLAGDIGEERKHIELEPLEVPATVPTTVPAQEPVPA